jgi:ABC-type lipoprotein release transport system permease subunit
MKRSVLWELARRNVWSRSNSPVVRMVGVLSVSGIAIGVSSLIILQAFMGGFMEAISQGLSVVNPPVYIHSPGGGSLDDFDLGALQSLAEGMDDITSIIGILEKPAVISGSAGTVSGAVVRGTGSSDRVVMGYLLARRLGVTAGDEVRVASTAGVEVSGTGRVLVDTIVTIRLDSIADFGLAEYNGSLLVMPLSGARAVFRTGSELTAAGGFIASGSDPVEVAEALDQILYRDYSSGGWPVYMSSVPFLAFHGNLFKALGLERKAMTIVLAMITVVAFLNLSSALAMISLEHRRDTGVLRAMGFPTSGVFAVSILRGLVLGGSGAVAGLLFSWVSVYAVNRFFPLSLDGEVYWIEVLPGLFPTVPAIAITLGTVFLCGLVAVFSALSSISCSPSEALRHE